MKKVNNIVKKYHDPISDFFDTIEGWKEEYSTWHTDWISFEDWMKDLLPEDENSSSSYS